LRKPLDEKARSVRFRWEGIVSKLRMPVRLPCGAWWVPRKDNLGEPLLAGTFETSEITFFERFLRPGMIVLDLGAHHGLYTLIASKRIGAHGKVFSFEPSPRERKALRLHLILNLCRNVTVEGLALGDENAEVYLYVVEGFQTGCNSLRPPAVISETSAVRVRVTRLDDWLNERKIYQVDFIKLDVEGAELAVLKGAAHLLESRPRPVILAEVQDIRTQPWAYRAKDIIEHLENKGYIWFGLSEGGSVYELDTRRHYFEGNFVACPEEKSETFHKVSTSSVSPMRQGSV
jgi:FkbM family methyltransferase